MSELTDLLMRTEKRCFFKLAYWSGLFRMDVVDFETNIVKHSLLYTTLSDCLNMATQYCTLTEEVQKAIDLLELNGYTVQKVK